MKKLLFLTLSFFVLQGFSQSLAIDSVSPSKGVAGTIIKIYGTGFSTNLSQNIVYFDNVKAPISACSTTELTLQVPKGAPSVSKIIVVNLATNKTATSLNSNNPLFNITFDNGNLTSSSYYKQTYSSGGNSEGVFAGDFDGDGFTDVGILANNPTVNDSIIIMKGNGTYSLSHLSSTFVGDSPKAIGVGDFDNDGDLDLIVYLNGTSDNVKILENDGTGHFSVAASISAGYVNDFVAADFNNDGYIDFAGSSSWGTYKFINNGSMSFVVSQISSQDAVSVEVGDFNEDGNMDVLATRYSSGTVEVFLGNGSGGFTSSGSVGMGGTISPTAKVAIADFNNDNHLDIVTSTYFNNRISVIFGDGTGNFSGLTQYTNIMNARDVRVGDFNGDGNIDIEAMCYTSSSSDGFYILIGNGNGTFNPPLLIAGTNVTTTAYSAAVTDINHDGITDLITANYSGDFQVHYYKAPTYSTISPIACNTYTSPSGIYHWTVSNTYNDTILNSIGVDSIITIHLTINPTYNLTETVTICSGGSYTFPDGTSQSNIIAQVIHTSSLLSQTFLCDSIIVTTVNVNPSYNLTETVNICSGSSYTFPDGTSQNNITAQVIHTSNLLSQTFLCDSIIVTTVNVNPFYNLTETVNVCSGSSYTFPDGTSQNNITAQVIHTSNLLSQTFLCDSIIETTLIVNPTYNQTETVTICSGSSYTFPDGTSQSNITAQVIHASNLLSQEFLCDSIIVTTVNVNPSYNQTETVTICSGGSYTFPDGTSQNNITAQVIHASNFTTQEFSCDSIIVTTVNVNPTYNLTETVNVCSGGSYTFPDGTSQSNITAQVIHTSNLLTQTFLCDSIIVTTVNVTVIDKSITQTDITLTANMIADSYQWLDCNNVYAIISGETNQSFTATVNGNYAVEITKNGCTDTSDCHLINSVGISENSSKTVKIYPNPVSNELNIEIEGYNEGLNFEIINAIGQVVCKGDFIGKTTVQSSDFAPGIYLIKLENGKTFEFRKMIKE